MLKTYVNAKNILFLLVVYLSVSKYNYENKTLKIW